MLIECSKFDEAWGKAARNISEEQLYSTYSWSDGVTSVERLRGDEREPLVNGERADAIFFDNTEYPIWVHFTKSVKKASFGSNLQSENDHFTFRMNILTGFLNYDNEIGRSEINIIYELDGKVKKFTFGFEVLSKKLDYHEHWKTIVEDIEKEYRMLTLDYMRRTFHGFTPDVNGETPELIWWNLFAQERENFVKACKNIIERPHHRLHGRYEYKRADRLTFIPASIENELAEHRKEPAYLYRVEERVQTNDTQENRFLKFAVIQITDTFARLKKRVEEQVKNISDNMQRDMDNTLNTLKRLQRNPFFRTVGRFKGLNQESMVLQKATGYSTVYRTWNLLRRGYSLYDGLYRLQTKDIATLYEIWCFIEVSHIVKEQLGIDDSDMEHRKRTEMNGLFTWSLGKGEQSRILFKRDDVELAELVYNPKSNDKEDYDTGMKDLVVPTVPQKPDIVLQLTKNDMRNNMKFTYLFDAKYRIDGKQKGVDVPPDDAINQMHRYRDAIYYKDRQNNNALKKEVIGGYILFPGDGNYDDIENARFYKTINEVNIGAFPLRPNDKTNRKYLEDFIRGLMDKKSPEIIDNVIPQKGTFVEVGNRVLIGFVKNSSRQGYLQSFEDGNATLYYTGSNFPTTIQLHDLHFFIPYMKEKGIRDVYEITGVRTITSREAKQLDDDNPEKNDIRLAFHLRFSHRLSDTYTTINATRLISGFIDTTFEGIKSQYIQQDTE